MGTGASRREPASLLEDRAQNVAELLFERISGYDLF